MYMFIPSEMKQRVTRVQELLGDQQEDAQMAANQSWDGNLG